MNNGLKHEIKRLIVDLTARRYAEMVADGRAGRLSAKELHTAIEAYGKTLLPLPDEAWDLVDEYPQVDAPNTVAVDVPLWTKEEGRSDLTLSLSATSKADKWVLHIDDLHAL